MWLVLNNIIILSVSLCIGRTVLYSSKYYDDIPWLYGIGGITHRRYYIRPTLPARKLHRDTIKTIKIDNKHTVVESHLKMLALPYYGRLHSRDLSDRTVTVYAVDDYGVSSCNEYMAHIIYNTTTYHYEFRQVHSSSYASIEDETNMIEYELNTLAKDHKLYQLDNNSSIINNIPNPDTIYHGVINHNPYIHINLQLNELKPRLDIQGEETEKTMELLVFPIGGKAAAAAAALFVQISIISDDGDDVTVRHLIMEPDDDGDMHNIGREKKGEVGYGVDNLGEWDNKYVVAHY